jgi:hypothetical protein
MRAPVAIFGIRGIRILLAERRHVRRVLPVSGVDAGRRRVQEPPDPVEAGGVQGVAVDQHAVPG